MTFDEFLDASLPSLSRFAGVLTGDRDLAQDVLQEVLARAHGRWPVISGYDRPESYVRKMVVNEFLSWRRRLRRLVPVGSVPDSAVPFGVGTPRDAATDHAESAALAALLCELSPRLRAVVVLRYYAALDDQAIAEHLGCKPSSVRVYVSRALAALRVRLTQETLVEDGHAH